MTYGILVKEWRQHRGQLLATVLVIAGSVLLIAALPVIGKSNDTPLEALRLLHFSLLPISCLVLAQALVASEYHHPVHVFIDGIPISRSRMVAIKFILGIAAVGSGLAVGLGLAVWAGRTTDAVTARQIAIIAARSFTHAGLVYSFTFAWAFTGRYRLAVAVVTIAVLVFMPTMPARGFEHAMPWALVGSDFAYERYDFPVVALLVAAFASLVWISVAFALGAGFGGHLGPALAQRMSSRERTVIISLLFAIAIIRFTYDENRKHNRPLHFPGAVEIVSPRTRVVVAAAVGDLLPEEQAAMERVAQWISGDLDRLATYLDCENLPPVHLVHRRNMLPHEIIPGDIVHEQGVMLRLDLRLLAGEGEELRARVIREALLARSLGRLEREQMSWVLDGFVSWWPGTLAAADSALANAGDSGREDMEIVERHDLDAWLTLRERVGADEAGSMAAGGLRFAAQRYGSVALRTFLGDVLGREVSRNAVASIRDAAHPVSLRWQRATGATLEDFVAEWAEWRSAVADTARRSDS